MLQSRLKIELHESDLIHTDSRRSFVRSVPPKPPSVRQHVAGVMTAARASAELRLITVPPINDEQGPQ